MNPAGTRPQRGFTLIEVLVALVIVAAGAGAVLAALSGAASGTTYLREKTFAQWIAANRIAELRVSREPPAPGSDQEGELEYAGQRWIWRQEVAEAEIPGLTRIEVSVRPVAAQLAEDEWTVTLTGVIGKDIATPTGAEPDWEPAAGGPPPSGNGGDTPPPTAPPGVTPPEPAPQEPEAGPAAPDAPQVEPAPDGAT